MTRSTTKLIRDLETANAVRVQEAWADRRAGHDQQRVPRWAVTTMLRSGAISAEQHDAAVIYRTAIEKSQGGSGGTSFTFVDGSRCDPHVRLWDMAQSLRKAQGAHSFVVRYGQGRQTTKPVLELLFAFNGHVVTGRLPTAGEMSRHSGKVRSSLRTEQQVRYVLDALLQHWWRSGVMDATNTARVA